MRILVFKTITILIAAYLLSSPAHAGETNTADVIVYGSTPGGFCAAIAAAREGASVILLEPTGHIGGMNTGGLSFSDSNQMYRETLMGLFHEWHLRIQEDYEDRGITLPYDVNVKDQTHWSYEPHVAFRVTTQMLAEAGVEVLTRRWLGSVNTNGAHIESLVTTSNDTFIADTFVDGSYEGDLMAAAGVSWTIGREGTAEYGESRAGKRYPKSEMNIDGFDTNGIPLPLITTTNAGATDAGDDNIMTYSFRLSLTTSAGNKIPMPAPDNYDSNRFEVVRRYVQEHGASSVGFDGYTVPNSKKDGNNSIGKQFSLGLVGGGKGWAGADEAGRAALFEAYKQYTLEFLYFLSNDPVFSASQQADIAKWGLCADEFPDTGHFSPYLYIRESRRMQGMYVLTENDIIDDPVKDDAIMVSSFPIDSHDCQRIAYPGGGVRNEGTIFPVRQGGRGYPYHVPYRAILPLTNQCDNLLVPVALSCTHVAISSLRIEGTWMLIGQSAGIAAAMAADQDVAVQDLPYTNLKTRLLAQGQVLDLPDGFQPPEPLTGIVLDDPDAELAGTWNTSTTFTPYVGDGYRYAGAAGTPNDGSSVATWRFTASTGGVYQLNMAYTPDPTRATNVPLVITSGPHRTQFAVDQTIERPAGSVVRSIGTVELVSSTESAITVSTTGTTGFVILDAIQLVLETPEVPDEAPATNSFQEGVSPTAAYAHDAVYIRSQQADSNQNNDGDQELIVGFTQTDEILRILLEFDISEIAASDQIDSVSLVLRTEAPQGGLGGSITVNVHEYEYDFDETNATWNAPGVGDGTAGGSTNGTLLTSATFDATTQNTDVTFGDTEAFRTAVSDALAGDGFLRMILARSGETPDGSHRFARFDDDTVTPAGNRPELRVVTRPEAGEIGTVFILR
jgi:hypothetical protein